MAEPKVHTFESTGEAYDASQCDDNIVDGDVLAIPGERVVGFLYEAWPVAVTVDVGVFHTATDLADMVSDPKRRASYDKAVEIARAHDLEVLVP